MAKNKIPFATKILAGIGGCTVANSAINAYKIYEDATTPTQWELSHSYTGKVTRQRNQVPGHSEGYEKS